MNRKTLNILICIIIAVSLFFMVCIYYKTTTNQSRQDSENCTKVGIEGHLYRGQCLVAEYRPEYLVRLSPRASWLTVTEPYLDIRAAFIIEKLITDAEAEGICLTVSSGYRSAEEQQTLVESIPDKLKVAIPNASEHQTGLAVDFRACPMDEQGIRDDSAERLELRSEFEELPEYKWLVDNAHKYDMEQSYRLDNENETGYPAESWHWKVMLK
jgi:D-alanyl-D-alanine carboxypeptidase